ncbi:MAG: hypothetical protein KAT90_03605, partial [Gammaproteobacteria bacterium]|nr:hypothetical protein [Gammaproteobacteria bacterium]
DGDGIPDSRDLDSDNDGIFDLSESGAASTLDADNNGRIDSTNTVGSNGLADVVESSADSGVVNYNGGNAQDTDADGVPNFRDLDSDNNAITDVIENGGSDADADALIGSGTPSVNADGITVGTTGVMVDTDGDGIPNALDPDADGDGINDLIEVGGIDADDDGMIDNFSDANGDGFDDAIAATPLTIVDANNNGIPDYMEAAQDSEIRTGLNGIGSSGLILPLFSLLLLVGRRVRVLSNEIKGQ